MRKLAYLLFLSFLTSTLLSAQDRVEEPRNRNVKPFMGVTLGTNWGDGVEIKSISKGFGAERAGLQKGDIVTAINSNKINNDDDFTRTVRKYKAGDEVEVSFLRGKEKMALKVKLAEAPNGYRSLEVLEDLGLSKERMEDLKEELEEIKVDLREDLEDLREDLRDQQQARIGIYPETDWSERAVKITGLTNNSPAKDAGLRKGDFITKIDKEEINTEEELRYCLKKHKPNEEILVTYKRDGKENTTKVKLGSERTLDWNKNISYNDTEGWGTSYSRKNDNNETRTWSSYTFADGTQVDLNDFTITPNGEKVNISFEAKLAQAFSVVVYNNSGKEVAREDRQSLEGKFEKTFDLPNAKNDDFVAKLWIAGKEAFSQKINK